MTEESNLSGAIPSSDVRDGEESHAGENNSCSCLAALRSRRRFLGEVFGFCTVACLSVAGGALCHYLMPPGKEDEKKPVYVKGSAIHPEKALAVMQGGRQVLLIAVREGGRDEIRAFSAVCTHLGCLVKWVPSAEVKCLAGKSGPPYVFFCPCHEGVFGPSGEVLAGPAPLPLEKVSLKMQGNQIIVGE
jgi:cytochrome b6-f complex iron-sulfur subunit